MSEGAVREALESYPASRLSSIRRVKLVPRLGWRVSQAVLDFATVFGAAGVSYGAYLLSGLGQQHFEPGLYAKLNLALAAVTVFALHGSGTYRGQMGLLRIEAVKRILHAVTTGVLLLLAVSFLVKFAGFSRLHVLLMGPVAILALVAQRFVVWAVADRLHASGRGSAPVIVYGAGETGRLLAQHLMVDHSLGLKPAAFLDDDAAKTGTRVRVGAGVDGRRVPVQGSEARLEQTIRETRAAAVFLALPSATPRRVAQLVSRIEAAGVAYYVVPSAGDLLFSGMQFGLVGGMPVFTPRRPETNRLYDMTKRLIDVLISLLVLGLSLPVLLGSALLIRLTSGGPVLFRQTRVGLNGRPFEIYKLRTMYPDAPSYARHPRVAGDGRVTVVGRWLRRFSVDELPQLWNVARGEMSLVGPRPEMPFVVTDYSVIQRQRLTVKPGVTGLWQISADRAFSIHDNIHYDLYYVEHRGLAIDLSILLLTPFVLLARNRAM